jgi:MFS family permease
MSWNHSPSPVQFSSRFSNWSYQDIGNAFKLFGGKGKIDTVNEIGEDDDELRLTSAVEIPTKTAQDWPLLTKIIHLVFIGKSSFSLFLNEELTDKSSSSIGVPMVCCSTRCSLLQLIAGSSNIAITAISSITQLGEDHVRHILIFESIPFSAYLVGLGLGWLFAVPVVQLFRRRLPLLVTATCFSLSQLAIGLSRGMVFLSCFRVLAGIFAGIACSIAQSSTEDVWSDATIWPRLLVTLSSFLGHTFGYLSQFLNSKLLADIFSPLYEYIVSSRLEERWVSLLIAFAIIPTAIAAFFMAETKRDSTTEYTSEFITLWMRIKTLFRLSLGRPLYILITTPSVMLLGLSTGAASAIHFALYRSLPQILSPVFSQSRFEQDFSYFSLSVGHVVGLAALLIYYSATSRRAGAIQDKSIMSQELNMSSAKCNAGRKLIPILPIIVLLPLSLAFFALTVTPDYSVFVPLSFLTIFSACSFVLFVSGMLHISEQAQTEKAAPSIAAYMLVVYAMSAGLSIGFSKLLDVLKLKGTFGAFSGATALFTISMLVLWICYRNKTRR